MLHLRLAKSMMEREEGMNHLWIQLRPSECSTVEQAEVRIQMPNGLYRDPNLNGYEESDGHVIFLDLSHHKDVLLELYTQTAVDLEEVYIEVTLKYQADKNWWVEFSERIAVRLIDEEELGETPELDQQVIERVKELRYNGANVLNTDDDSEISLPRIYELRNNKYGYLEQKYRVEY